MNENIVMNSETENIDGFQSMMATLQQLKSEAIQEERSLRRMGLFTPSTVGKRICGKPKEFCQWLVSHGIVHHLGKMKFLTPSPVWLEKKYFFIDHGYHKENKIHYWQTYFTLDGAKWITKIYEITEGILDGIEIETMWDGDLN